MVARRAELKNFKVPAFKIGISCRAAKSFKNSKWAKIKAQRQKYHNFKELGLVIGASRSPGRRASSTLVLLRIKVGNEVVVGVPQMTVQAYVGQAGLRSRAMGLVVERYRSPGCCLF